MKDLIEYPATSVVPANPTEGSNITIEMVRHSRFLDDEFKKLLDSKPSLLAQIFPSLQKGNVKEFQNQLADLCREALLRDSREMLNDKLLRHAAYLRAETVNFCRQMQAEVEGNFSAHLRLLSVRICEDMAFCRTLPEGFVRDEYEQAIRENFREMLVEYRRTNSYFNDFLDTQIKNSNLVD